MTFLILSGFYFFVLQIFSWQHSAKALAVVLIVLTGLSSYFVNQLGVNINPDQIQNVMQTDVDEAFDLLSVPFLLWIIQTVVLPLIVVFYIKIKPIQSIRYLFLINQSA